MKINSSLFLGLALFGLSLAMVPSVTAQNSSSQQMSSDQKMPTDQKMDSGSQKMAKSADVAFAIKAAQGGMAEVQLGKLAAEKAESPDVKSFGQLMVDDHSKANDQLKEVAEKENMTLPTTIDAKDQALYSKLQTMSGADFDKYYMKHMVQDHEKDVKEFKKEAGNGNNQQIKTFAANTLPVLEGHLSRAKGIEKRLTGKGPASNS